MEAMHANDAAIFISTAIKDFAEHCIPQRKLRERKSTHPWLNDTVETSFKQKVDAVGTTDERNAAEKCSAGILAFIEKIRFNTKKLARRYPCEIGAPSSLQYQL